MHKLSIITFLLFFHHPNPHSLFSLQAIAMHFLLYSQFCFTNSIGHRGFLIFVLRLTCGVYITIYVCLWSLKAIFQSLALNIKLFPPRFHSRPPKATFCECQTHKRLRFRLNMTLIRLVIPPLPHYSLSPFASSVSYSCFESD